MQTLLFVFVGVHQNKSNITIEQLTNNLIEKFKENNTPIELKIKEKLIIGRFDNVGYYASLLESAKELKDWYKMAKDFELKIEKKPVSKENLLDRYDRLARLSDNRYKKDHFSVALLFFEELEKSSAIEIYAFQ